MTETTFIPGPDTARAFRDALGCFATGVTVVTTLTDEGPLAMTANSFASVSLEPPLVLWCPAQASSRYAAFSAAQHFAIHVMAEDQQELAVRFARNGSDFDAVAWRQNNMGQPVLPDVVARFDCTRHALHEAGDHGIIVGEVKGVSARSGNGLVFKRGQFGGFSGLI